MPFRAKSKFVKLMKYPSVNSYLTSGRLNGGMWSFRTIFISEMRRIMALETSVILNNMADSLFGNIEPYLRNFC